MASVKYEIITIINTIRLTWSADQCHLWSYILKQKCWHFEDIFFTASTKSCDFNNFLCNQNVTTFPPQFSHFGFKDRRIQPKPVTRKGDEYDCTNDQTKWKVRHVNEYAIIGGTGRCKKKMTSASATSDGEFVIFFFWNALIACYVMIAASCSETWIM